MNLPYSCYQCLTEIHIFSKIGSKSAELWLHFACSLVAVVYVAAIVAMLACASVPPVDAQSLGLSLVNTVCWFADEHQLCCECGWWLDIK